MNRTITTGYKLHWVMQALIRRMEPKVILRKVSIDYLPPDFKRKTTQVREVVKCKFNHLFDFTTPFPDVTIHVTPKEIHITGNGFVYEFPPSEIMYLWNRIKKLKG